MMKKKLLNLAVLTALSSTVLLSADVRVSGFVNVVAGVNDINPKKYIPNETSESYRGYDDKYDFQNESLAAIQFSANVSDKMGATIQLIAQKQEYRDDIRMEWGYISYDLSDEVRVLAGRIRPALFLYSDYLDVGFAYTWITAPDEVYSQASVTNIDGLNFSYNIEFGDNQLSLTAFGGNAEQNNGKNIDGSDLIVSYDATIGGEIAFTTEYAKLRAGYIQTKLSATVPTSTPDELKADEVCAELYGIGLSVDYENLTFAAEYTVRKFDGTAYADVTSSYAMVGYKIGNFTPNYTYAVADSDMDFAVSGTVTDITVNTVRAANLDDRFSHTLGVRYDINAKAALKLEYNMATLTHSQYIGGTNLRTVDEDINTARIALNVIF